MLAAIGAPDLDTLFEEIPPALRVGELPALPKALNELQVTKLMEARAADYPHPLCFLGAGAYEHHIPAAVWEIVGRGEFYSAYTPYQPEASQGTLQVLYEYQSMMAGLTGLAVSNASLYDGGSALAEALLMAVRANRKSKSKRVLVPGPCIRCTDGPPMPSCTIRASNWWNCPTIRAAAILQSRRSRPTLGRISRRWSSRNPTFSGCWRMWTP